MVFEANMWFWHALWISIGSFMIMMGLTSILSRLPVIGPYFSVEDEFEDTGPENNSSKNPILQGIVTIIVIGSFIIPLYLFFAFAMNGQELFIIHEDEGKTVGEEKMIYYGDDEILGFSVFLGNNIFTRIEPGVLKLAEEYEGWDKPLYNATNSQLYITQYKYRTSGRGSVKAMGVLKPGQTGTFSHSGHIQVGCHEKLPTELSVQEGRLSSAYITRITEKPDAECPS